MLNTITDPSSRSVSYDYTANSRIAAVYDSGTGGTTSYAYDAADRETSALQANGVTVAKTYDDAGEITSVVNQNASSATLSIRPRTQLMARATAPARRSAA